MGGWTGAAIAASWKRCFVERCRRQIMPCTELTRGINVRGREVGREIILAEEYGVSRYELQERPESKFTLTCFMKVCWQSLSIYPAFGMVLLLLLKAYLFAKIYR